MVIPPAKRLEQVEEYYFSQKLRQVQELKTGGMQILNLAIGSPDLPPSKETIDTLCQAAIQEQSHSYQPYRGIDNLRSAMADWYKKIYSVEFQPQSQILPLMGSKEGLFHISKAFLNPGDQILAPDPGYLGYVAAAKLVGAEVLFYDLNESNNWMPDIEKLSKMDTSRVKILWMNYPHMPTGAVAGLADFQQLVDFARERKILICHDNPYSLILNIEKPLSIFRANGAFECCLELNSLSKSHHMAGWRVGMLIGKADYLNTVLKVKSNIDSGMFLAIQAAAIQALQNSREWHQQQNQCYQQRRKLVHHLLDIMGFNYSDNTVGMFVWAKAPDHLDNVEAFLDMLLYQKGIFFAPGKVFGKNGERYIRVSLCAAKEDIQKAIELVH